MVQISLQNSGGKVVFYGWVPRTPPWAPTRVKVPWSLLSVNRAQLPKKGERGRPAIFWTHMAPSTYAVYAWIHSSSRHPGRGIVMLSSWYGITIHPIFSLSLLSLYTGKNFYQFQGTYLLQVGEIGIGVTTGLTPPIQAIGNLLDIEGFHLGPFAFQGSSYYRLVTDEFEEERSQFWRREGFIASRWLTRCNDVENMDYFIRWTWNFQNKQKRRINKDWRKQEERTGTVVFGGLNSIESQHPSVMRKIDRKHRISVKTISALQSALQSPHVFTTNCDFALFDFCPRLTWNI